MLIYFLITKQKKGCLFALLVLLITIGIPGMVYFLNALGFFRFFDFDVVGDYGIIWGYISVAIGPLLIVFIISLINKLRKR